MIFRKLTAEETREFQQAVFDGTAELKWDERALYHPATRLAMAQLLISEVLGRTPPKVSLQEMLGALGIPWDDSVAVCKLLDTTRGEA